MTIYLGPGVGDWPGPKTPRQVTWLYSAPVVGNPMYPVVLDVAESAQAAVSDELLSKACGVLAPVWEELQEYRLTQPREPRTNEIPNNDNALATERYLLGAVAHALSRLGPEFGVVLRHPQRYDPGSAVFVQRLLSEATLKGLQIAIEGPVGLARSPRYNQYLADYKIVPSSRTRHPDPNLNAPATELLALTSQGVPLAILHQLGLKVDSGIQICAGTAGEAWAFLRPSWRRVVRKRLSMSARRILLDELFDAWDPKGWGYLRRAAFPILAGDIRRMLSQHVPYLYGIGTIGLDFLYRQFTGLARRLHQEGQLREHAAAILSGAGRIAPRIRVNGGFDAAIWYWRRALQYCSEPAEQTAIIYEIANNYAVQRYPAALGKARKWYHRGYEVLESITKVEDRLREEIRLANGLALVEYHEGNNHKALSLERRAHLLADAATAEYPDVAQWAKPLLNFNTAKLLEKRFSNFSEALRLLEENRSLNTNDIRETASLDIARACFDRGEYRRVVEALSSIYENRTPTIMDEEQEMVGRFMYSISLLAVGENNRVRTQLRPLTYLSRVAGSSHARKLVEVIEDLSASTSQFRNAQEAHA